MPGRTPASEVTAASSIPVLVGAPVSTYSQSPWGPCGTEESDITRLGLGDLPPTF